MSVLVVIPARHASTRFPGKPLVNLVGASGISKPLIRRTWDTAKAIDGVDEVVISTDDLRIKLAAEDFGAQVVMTSESCENGTERCAETHAKLGDGFDIVVNLQGDAPLTPPWFVEELVTFLKQNPSAQMATPVLKCSGKTLRGLVDDRKNGRVGGTTAVFDRNQQALYFSKEVIPFVPNSFSDNVETPVFHHVGVYAYRSGILGKYQDMNVGPLEKNEGLEQLRFLENGLPIYCVEVDAKGRQFWELNNPEDVRILESMMTEMDLD